MISTSEADRLIDHTLAQHWKAGTCVDVPVALSIGRVLGRDIFADSDQPPFDRVAMDGVAIVFDEGVDTEAWRTGFHVEGRLPAGVAQPEGMVRPGSIDAIEVMTGAALPKPWNAVVPWEDVEPTADGGWRLRKDVRIARGMNIHARATDYRRGDSLLAKGSRIHAPDVHILASVGCVEVPVVPFPRVFLVATGDELVDVAATPSPYQIRMSNMVALEACLHRAGFSVGKAMHLPDREESLRSGLVEALAESDVLLISGGVSKGSKDLVPPVLLSLGCTRVFHGVAHKPGKPMWFGFSAQGAIIFALPGNPVASLVCFLRYVLPRLRSWGEARNAGGSFASSHVLPLVSHVEAREGYTLFLPALLEARADGSAGVRLRKSRGSGDFAGLHPSDGIVELPAGAGGLPAGTPVRFLPWP